MTFFHRKNLIHQFSHQIKTKGAKGTETAKKTRKQFDKLALLIPYNVTH